MTGTDPEDAPDRSAWLSARRAVVRAHHPDAGGDEAEFVRLLAEVDEQFVTQGRVTSGPRASPPATDRSGDTTGKAGTLRRISTRAGRSGRRVERAARSRLPRGWPGARRWIDL